MNKPNQDSKQKCHSTVYKSRTRMFMFWVIIEHFNIILTEFFHFDGPRWDVDLLLGYTNTRNSTLFTKNQATSANR